MAKSDLERRKQDPGEIPVTGCGDSSCEVASHSGMCTNGGCSCDERELRRALRWYKRKAAFLDETIRSLKDDISQLRFELTSAQIELGNLKQ